MLNCEPDTGRFDLHLARIDPRRARIDAAVESGGSAASVARSRSASIVVNANFFDERYRPLGLVVAGGQTLTPLHHVSWQSIFSVDRAGSASIVLPEDWISMKTSRVTAVQAGPRLVVAGSEIRVAPARPEPRSGVCIDATGRVILFATPEDAYFDVQELANIAAGAMGCREAMLFDGGPSVQLFVRGFVDQPGDPRVPAFLVVH